MWQQIWPIFQNLCIAFLKTIKPQEARRRFFFCSIHQAITDYKPSNKHHPPANNASLPNDFNYFYVHFHRDNKEVAISKINARRANHRKRARLTTAASLVALTLIIFERLVLANLKTCRHNHTAPPLICLLPEPKYRGHSI